MKLKFRIQRLIRFEFWPMYIFYLPIVPVWFLFSLLSGTLIYFTRVNPHVRFGGFFNYSKYKMIEGINQKYLPKTRFYSTKPKHFDFYKQDFSFPFVCKPDIGERGKDVVIIRNEIQWLKHFSTINYAFILQEFVDYKMEFGVLYYRFPSGDSGITSVVGKSYLKVIGDGKHTLMELLSDEIMASKRMDDFRERFRTKWNKILPKGEELIIEQVGNHCKGTTFIDRCDFINVELVKAFDEVVKTIPDFHYGRFDLKVNSEKDLYSGKIKVFELNGVNSEVAHIYQPNYSLFKAYKHIVYNFYLVFKISKALKRRGVKLPNTFAEFFKDGVSLLKG